MSRGSRMTVPSTIRSMPFPLPPLGGCWLRTGDQRSAADPRVGESSGVESSISLSVYRALVCSTCHLHDVSGITDSSDSAASRAGFRTSDSLHDPVVPGTTERTVRCRKELGSAAASRRAEKSPPTTPARRGASVRSSWRWTFSKSLEGKNERNGSIDTRRTDWSLSLPSRTMSELWQIPRPTRRCWCPRGKRSGQLRFARAESLRWKAGPWEPIAVSGFVHGARWPPYGSLLASASREVGVSALPPASVPLPPSLLLLRLLRPQRLKAVLGGVLEGILVRPVPDWRQNGRLPREAVPAES